ncbi:hypothetical protein CDV55_106487 [Aspergillus turcosus]|uniref:HMG box domain-containing protein n=1 Tax=Aspergillus turcosus TaxID=1245748 RepID=A0A229Z3R5_9EURO|nr:hypothetical protein CDV55_106487 [Aspergillus turcosus]RLL99710.1 hypothetical protein CFD26_105571 [Aspergillus turcosus]
MSRKDDAKAHDGQVTVNVEDFTRTRESLPPENWWWFRRTTAAHPSTCHPNRRVLVCLSNLQAAVSDLTRAYITHTNTVLHPSLSDLGHVGNITAALLENGVLGARSSSPGAKSEAGDKKKRKRAPPDPNAPKRALTPYFLYMQHNRPLIAQEMGPSARPKDVSDEGTRRWSEMPDSQKEVWKKLYADNLAVYKKKVEAYKAGKPWTEDDNTRAASQLQQDIAGASASGGEESDEEEEEEETEESSPEPVREPSPPRSNKRRRSEVKTPSKKKDESPEKKKRTSARKGSEKDKEEEPPASTRKAAADDAKRSKKKRKSQAGADE